MLIDDIDGLGLRNGIGVLQERSKLRKYWLNPNAAAGVMLGLTGSHDHATFGQIHVGPLKGEQLGRDAEPSDSGKGDDEPPFGVWALIHDLVKRLKRDKELTRSISPRLSPKLAKWVFRQNFQFHGIAEELPSDHAAPFDCVFSKSLFVAVAGVRFCCEPDSPIACVLHGNRVERACLFEKGFQASHRVAIDRGGALFNVASTGNVRV